MKNNQERYYFDHLLITMNKKKENCHRRKEYFYE